MKIGAPELLWLSVIPALCAAQRLARESFGLVLRVESQLQNCLEAEYRAGRLVYGMHKSRETLLTCIVQSYNGNHLHFVDGSDGGYALAATALERRFSELLA